MIYHKWSLHNNYGKEYKIGKLVMSGHVNNNLDKLR